MDAIRTVEELLAREPKYPDTLCVWWASRDFWENWTEDEWHAAEKESGRVYRELVAALEAAYGTPVRRVPSADELGDSDFDFADEDAVGWPPAFSTYWIHGEKRVCVWEVKDGTEAPFTVNIAVVWDE